METTRFRKAVLMFTVLLMSISVGTMFGSTDGEKLTMKGGSGGSGTSPRSGGGVGFETEVLVAYLYRDAGEIETTFLQVLGDVTITVKDISTNAVVSVQTVNSAVERIVITDIAKLASGDYMISYANGLVNLNMYAEFQIE